MATPFLTCTATQIQDFLKEAGFPAFRYKQVVSWVYGKQVSSYDDMTNLPKAMREELSRALPLIPLEMADRRISKDGTRKYLFRLHDGNLVETVALPSLSGKDRLTVCFSTQVGCGMGCVFCATGHEGFTRNLGTGEIAQQILLAQQDMGMRVSNLVGMGQGEPFLNFQAVADALKLLNDPKGIAIGARHITVSTCGVIPGIAKFKELPQQFTMAVSLHSAIQGKRNEIMPKAATWPLSQLKKALQDYIAATNRRVTFEYLLIKGVNDGKEDLQALASYCSGLLCHINLLPMNSIASSPFQPTAKKTLAYWVDYLESAGIETTIRKSRGADIDGACGQLKNSFGA